MPATFRHFAINAEDVDRARAFYEGIFGWNFTPLGPPGFFQTCDAGKGVKGALQKQQGSHRGAFIPTFEVEDIRATLASIEASGGKIAMPPFRIDGVGEIGYFEDPDGNLCGLGQYVPGEWD